MLNFQLNWILTSETQKGRRGEEEEDGGFGGSHDVQQSVSVQLLICMMATRLIKESFPVCKKERKKVIISALKKICMCVEDLCCFSVLEVTVKKKKRKKIYIFPFSLFFKQAFATPRLPLSFFARQLLLFCSLILTATADCEASPCRTSSANGPKHHPGTLARRY